MNGKAIYSDTGNFERDVMKSELPVLVYFYSEDCPPCMALTPMYDRIAEAYGGHMKFVKVFRQHNRQLAESYNIKSSPTLMFFKDGKEICSRLNGYITKSELRKNIETILGNACTRKERTRVSCDVLILGGGPAGLSAAIYAARAKLFTVVVDEGLTGGQVATTFHVANYPGTNGVVRGRGVHYCATCDAAMYQDANVLVAGGGNSAVEEAVFLARYARHVSIIHQFDRFQAAKSAQDEVLRNPNISVVWDSEIRKIHGEGFVRSVTVENLKTKEQKEIKCDGVFVYIGMQPKTQLFEGVVSLNEYGFIIVDEDMKTSVSGVFAAGDVREKKVRQIATAVSDGAISGIMAERYINGR
jgi:thioredoxin reductase